MYLGKERKGEIHDSQGLDFGSVGLPTTQVFPSGIGITRHLSVKLQNAFCVIVMLVAFLLPKHVSNLPTTIFL